MAYLNNPEYRRMEILGRLWHTFVYSKCHNLRRVIDSSQLGNDRANFGDFSPIIGSIVLKLCSILNNSRYSHCDFTVKYLKNRPWKSFCC